jgi:hypothetical protein
MVLVSRPSRIDVETMFIRVYSCTHDFVAWIAVMEHECKDCRLKEISVTVVEYLWTTRPHYHSRMISLSIAWNPEEVGEGSRSFVPRFAVDAQGSHHLGQQSRSL